MAEQMKTSGIDWIGDIPIDWEIGRVKDFYKLQTGFTPDTSMAEYYDDENGELWVSIADIESKLISTTKSKISKLYVREKHPEISCKGSLLYSFKLSVGKVGFIATDMYTNEAIASFYPQNRCLSFLYYSSIFIEENANRNIYGAKILNQDLIKNAYIIYPPISEQQTIADYLDKQCAKIDSIAADLEKQIEILQKYKKSLITETVTKGLDKTVLMKDSGIDWIGEIPADWNVIRITKYLDSLVDYRGKTPEKTDDGIFLVTARNIKNGKVDYSLSQEYVAESDYNEIMHRGKPQIGDVLFTTEAPLGEVANVDNTNIALAQRIIKFDGRKNCLNNYFLKYWLMSVGFQSFLWSLATGSTALGIASSKLGQLKMVLPRYEDQLDIVLYLDEKCVQIDDVLNDKKQQLETIQQHKKSLIYEYVTGKKRVKGAL